MSFQEKVESWRTKTGPGKVRIPVLVGLTSLALLVMLGAGSILVRTVSSDGFSVVQTQENPEPDGMQEGRENGSTICVHVGGAVVAPGVVKIASGSRVCDAIDAAGGFTNEAVCEALNLARVMTDGEQVIVPVQEAPDVLSGGGDTSQGEAFDRGVPSKVNINTASVEELDTLPGIGLSTADKIVADRKTNGAFASPEDLKRVSGIGDKKYAALADRICIG